MGCNAAALPLPALLGIVTAAAQMRVKLGAAASEVLIGAVQEYLMHGKLSQGETCLLVWGMSELQQVRCCAQPPFAILHSCPLVWKKVVNSSSPGCFLSCLVRKRVKAKESIAVSLPPTVCAFPSVPPSSGPESSLFDVLLLSVPTHTQAQTAAALAAVCDLDLSKPYAVQPEGTVLVSCCQCSQSVLSLQADQAVGSHASGAAALSDFSGGDGHRGVCARGAQQQGGRDRLSEQEQQAQQAAAYSRFFSAWVLVQAGVELTPAYTHSMIDQVRAVLLLLVGGRLDQPLPCMCDKPHGPL